MTELTIIDWETDEQVGVVNENGHLRTNDDLLREAAEELSAEGGINVITAGGAEGVQAYDTWKITPDDEGFLRALVEYLPDPYGVDLDEYNDLAQYTPPEESRPQVEPDVDESEEAADKAAEAALKVLPRGDAGNEGTAEKADSALSAEEYERCDDVLKQMHENLAQWDGEDLSKAPPAWTDDEDIPQFVFEAILGALDEGVVWDKFEGYSQQAANAIRNSLQENLTQPQGWSIGSIVDDLLDMYPGMEQGKALNIAQTEVSGILNTAREGAYRQREGSDDYVYYWQGPNDHRTTEVCAEIEEEIEARGGSVPLEELQEILMAKAEKYEGTREGGTPERVDEWIPHFQCRRTFIRDVKADL